MKQSETIGNLALALSKAQATMPPAKMNATNPFLKSRYADLGSIAEAAKKPLADNGLAYVQMVSAPDSDLMTVELTTMLMHESGEWLQATMAMPFQEERGKSLSQAVGSVITYARRYALAAMLGIVADEDMDGTGPDAGSSQPTPRKADQATMTVKPTAAMTKRFHALGTEVYGDEWDEKRPQLVSHVTGGRSESSKHLERGEMEKLITGMEKKQQESS